ncbi:MAG: aldehyde dehydrogenase family protein [Acidimicrobiales bacterium]
MSDQNRLFIDGAWVPSQGSGTIGVVNATTEAVIGQVPDGVAADVDAAVAAAKAAFEGWSQTSVEDRAKVLSQVSEGLLARQNEIAAVISAEMGMPYAQANVIQVGLPAMTWASMAELVRSYAFEERVNNSLVVREPIGVVGAITPWNYPLHQVSGKVAPALAVGCTVVLKPSEVAPLSAYLLAEVLADVGLPPGVFNLVSGTGPVVGEAMCVHPDVDMVSFTGSTAAGRRVAQNGAETIKRVTLELGGKSPFVILDDADLDLAVAQGVAGCLLNSGQTCSALTRMLVPRDRLDEVEQQVRSAFEMSRLGDPLDPETTLGPLVSSTQRDRVREYIGVGIDEGAKLVTGGAEAPEGLDTGYFVRPTAFSEVTPEMRIAQEEVFGPVLVIQPYEDEDDAVRIANDTIYGLSGGVFSADPDRALRVARRLRTGQVEVNGGAWNAFAPFGGYKQSGSGREFGTYGLEDFLEIKSIQL